MGKFTINKKQAGAPLQVLWYGFIQTILKAEVNVGFRNSPSEWVYAYAFSIGQALILMLSIWKFYIWYAL